MEQAIQLTGHDELRRSWGWYLVLGIALVVLGAIAMGSAFLMTIASVFSSAGFFSSAGSWKSCMPSGTNAGPAFFSTC